MKKLIFAVLIATTVMTSAFAAETKVSGSAVSNFNASFKKASNVTWTSANEYVKASFVLDNQNMEAFYSPDGEMIGTSKAITLDELPVKAKRAFAKRYGSYNVKEAIRFDGAEESASYISAENDKEVIIVKVDDASYVSLVSTTKK